MPYWRTFKNHGELNPEYPDGIEAQREKLKSEGHTIIQKGRKKQILCPNLWETLYFITL